MEFKEEYRRIYDNLDNKEKKTFRKALLNDDMGTLTPFFNRFSALDQNQTTEKAQGAEKKKKKGEKNRGLTKKHYEDIKAKQRADYKDVTSIKQADSFKPEIIHAVGGEIVDENNINEFKELYELVCISELEKFKSENPELTKKYASTWYKQLFLNIRKNTPKIKYTELDKLTVAWECYSNIMFCIGLYPTVKYFYLLMGIYEYQLTSMGCVNSAYVDFLKRIKEDTCNALESELAYNPYNSTNKIFVAKVNGIIEKTEHRVIEVNHNIRNYENLPMFNTDNE